MPSVPAESQRSVFRQMVRSSALYSAAMMAQKMVGVLMLPVMTHYLLPADYGMADLVEQVAQVLSLLVAGGFCPAFGYFYFASDEDQRSREAVGTALGGAMLLGLLITVVGLFGANQFSHLLLGNDSAALYLRVITAAAVFGLLLEVLFYWLRVENRSYEFMLASWLRVVLAAGGIVLFVAVFRLRVMGILGASLSSILATAFVLLWYCFRKARPLWNAHLFRQMLRYGSSLGVGGVAMFVVHFGDRFMLARFRTITEVGLYAIAYKVGWLVNALFGSFYTYWSSQIYQVARREDGRVLMARTFTYVTALLTFVLLGMAVAIRPVLVVMTRKEYYAAAPLVPLLALGYYLRSLAGFFQPLLLVQGRPKLNAACDVTAGVLAVTGYVLLIPRFGLWGAAWATTGTFLIISVVTMVCVYRIWPYRVEGVRLLKIAVAAGLPLIGHFLLPPATTLVDFARAATLLAAYPLILWVLAFATPGELDALRKLIGQLRAKVGARSATA